MAQQFTQGNITGTDNPLDIAINGGGFFQVRDTAGAVTYTRNGQFKVDSDGFIVNNQRQPADGLPGRRDRHHHPRRRRRRCRCRPPASRRR